MKPDDRDRLRDFERGVLAALAGATTALAVAGALVPVRTDLGGANVGFILVLVVVAAAAVGGRGAGLATAVSSALSFNWFHTQPYLSFAVAAEQDAVSVVLLGVVGVLVGELSVRLVVLRREAAARLTAATVLDDGLRALAAGTGLQDLWDDVRVGVVSTGAVRRVVFRPTGAVLGEDVVTPQTYTVPVVVEGREIGQVLVVLGPARGADRTAAGVARAAASVLGAAFAVHRGEPVPLD